MIRGIRAPIAVLLAITLIACAGETSAPLRVGLSIWPPNEMAYLANEQNMFGGHEIELIDFGAPNEYFPGYVTGGYDVAAMSLGSALELASIDANHRIVMFVDYSNGADALVAQSAYRDSADLKGKRIGYEASALTTYMLSRYLTLIGLRLDEIEPVPMDFVMQEQSFLASELDAVATWEPNVSRLVAAGAHVVIDSRATPGEAMDVIVVRQETLDNRRSELRGFVDGWFRALDMHTADPAHAGSLAESRKHVLEANYLRAFENIVMLDREANRRLFVEDREQLIEALNRHRDFLVEVGLVREDLDVVSVLDASLFIDST